LKRKLDKNGYKCIYLEAPHLLPMTSMIEIEGQLVEISNGDRNNAKVWFMYSENDASDASMALQEMPMEYFGLDESISMVKDCLLKLETTESCTIFGFSQGATFSHILSILASAARKMPENAEISPFAKIDSVILVSGFPSMHQDFLGDKTVATDSNDPIPLRSLHIFGEEDTSVPKSYGDKLASRYLNPQIYVHEKGHFIPHNKTLCDTVIEFLDKMSKVIPSL
jgi:predicted esterase